MIDEALLQLGQDNMCKSGQVNISELLRKLQEKKTMITLIPRTKVSILTQLEVSEKAQFKSKMKTHYKGELNEAAALRYNPNYYQEEEEKLD